LESNRGYNSFGQTLFPKHTILGEA
jgi:hypothetical protein